MSYYYGHGQPRPQKGATMATGERSSVRFFMNPLHETRLPSTAPEVALRAADVMIDNNECGRAVNVLRNSIAEHQAEPRLRAKLIEAYGRWGTPGRMMMAEMEYELALMDGAADAGVHEAVRKARARNNAEGGAKEREV